MFIIMNNKSPLTIMKFLIENKGEFHVREIARKTDLSLGFVSRVLRELHKERLISVRRKGRMTLYNIEANNPIVKQIKILFTVMKIYPLIKRISSFSRRVILFGSAARGENVPESDIDLFVISKETPQVRTVVDKFPDIVPIIMGSPEFNRLKSADPALYEQVNRGVVLWEQSEQQL